MSLGIRPAQDALRPRSLNASHNPFVQSPSFSGIPSGLSKTTPLTAGQDVYFGATTPKRKMGFLSAGLLVLSLLAGASCGGRVQGAPNPPTPSPVVTTVPTTEPTTEPSPPPTLPPPEPSPAPEPPTETPPPVSTEVPANLILENRPFVPTNINLFNPSVYPESTPALPAQGPAPTEDQVRTMLQDYLEAEFPNNSGKQQSYMQLFDRPAVVARIPNPSLRAGLLGLANTLAEPAIDFVLGAKTLRGNPVFNEIKFGELPENVVATVVPAGTADAEQFNIIFNQRLAAENPFLFTRTFAHEPLHQDNANGVYEEGLITAIDTLVYLHQLAYHPELATQGTWLSRFHNTNALARLNSGLGSELGLLETNGNGPILPGSTVDFNSFWNRYRDNPSFEATPGNFLLRVYLKNLKEDGAPKCSADAFNQALLECLDQNQGSITDEELVRAAQALQLDIDEDSQSHSQFA